MLAVKQELANAGKGSTHCFAVPGAGARDWFVGKDNRGELHVREIKVGAWSRGACIGADSPVQRVKHLCYMDRDSASSFPCITEEAALQGIPMVIEVCRW